MSDRQPPRLAVWLLTHAIGAERCESLVGDLIERHGQGRSATWFWRQTLVALVADLWAEKILVVSVLLVSQYVLNWLYMFVLWPTVVRRLYLAWYPPLIRWLLARDLDTVRLAAYRLGLEGLTGTLAGGALLMVAVWAATRIWPRRRGLIATLFILSQVGQCLPYLHDSFQNWLTYRHNDPSWFFAFFRFALGTFVLTPLSVFAAASYHSREKHQQPGRGHT